MKLPKWLVYIWRVKLLRKHHSVFSACRYCFQEKNCIPGAFLLSICRKRKLKVQTIGCKGVTKRSLKTPQKHICGDCILKDVCDLPVRITKLCSCFRLSINIVGCKREEKRKCSNENRK